MEPNGHLVQPRLDANDYEMIDLMDLIPFRLKIYPVTVEDLLSHFSPDKTVPLDRDISELISENLFDLF